MRAAYFITMLFVLAPISGCIGSDDEISVVEQASFYPDIYDRQYLEWDWDGTYSMVLEPGPYEALPVQEALIEV
ncbi:MAG: hypothetical protein VW270_22780, partial [Candidatus Poseidoniales archaeon]